MTSRLSISEEDLESGTAMNDFDVEKGKTESVGKLHPIQLYFKDLHFSVKLPDNKKLFKKDKSGEDKPQYKHILKGISGTVNPGTLLAIMGSSGAGKTTLLNLLAGRAQGKIEGELLFNGHSLQDSKALKRYTTYIMQDDVLLANQTPKEILSFSAQMKISSDFTPEQKQERVEEVIKELNLKNCQDTFVGAPGLVRGVSGGERKRVAIGNEIIDNPSLLFVDEPTSGLDSSMAESVISSLRDLARTGRTVITTIHQPNSDIYDLFDQLMLLAAGNIVYFGPANKAVDYFASIGYPCKQYTNPADFFMKLIHLDPSSEESKQRVDRLVAAYKESDMYRQNQKELPNIVEIPKEAKKRRDSNQNFFTQFGLLAKRNFMETSRNPLQVRAMLGQTIFLALILGLLYLRVKDGQSTSSDRLGCLFFLLVNQGMGSVMGVVTTFPAHRAVFFREHSNNMYSTVSFFLSKVLSDLPFQIFFPVLFGTITYWMIGFVAEADNFFIFLVVLVIVANVGSALGMLLGTAAPDASVAISLVPVTLIPFMIFSGFFINTDNVPPYFIWIEYISFIKYGFHALVLNEFTDLKFTCTESQKILTPTGSTCAINTGKDVIRNLGFDNFSIGNDIAVLIGLYIFIRIISCVVLAIKAKKQSANA